MSETPEIKDQPTPEELLSAIHTDLNDEKAQTRLSAIRKLLQQKFSSPAILHTLEQMAIQDRSKSVREAARQALASPTHRYIQGHRNKLKRNERQIILDEISNWETQGLIQNDHADVIRQRYDFDIQPLPKPVETTPLPIPEPDSAKIAEEPAPPRAGLTQTLLSETSIKVALYLGAFFVIAAAAILAAVVESARIPILLFATALFAGGSLITKKSLPQPSFALFVVFSFLLPTDANVLADVLSLSDKANSIYWFAVMGIMALIWGFGTWFYTSRLFSLAAFIALGISVIRLGEFFEELEIYMLLLGLATLIGLGGAYILKRWQSNKFSLPLFILVQVTQLGLNAFAFVAFATRLDDIPSTWNLASSFFWLLTAGFYVLSDLVFSFVLFPWLATSALYLVPLAFMTIFDVEAPPVATVTWIWGACLAFGSEILRRTQLDGIRRFVLPLLLTSIPVTFTAILIGLTEDITYAFAFMLASTILYAVLQTLKPRVYIWVTSLFLGLGAYFSFFALPFMEEIEVYLGYQILGVSLLLLVPDLFLKPNLSANKLWRWPVRILGAAWILLNILTLVLTGKDDSGKAALIFSIYAVFFILYALRYGKAWLGYLATAFAPLSILFALQHFESDIWLPTLTAFSALYYLAGFALGQNEKLTSWSDMLRYSGLGLMSITTLTGVIASQDYSGWYVLIAALTFGVEMFSRSAGLGEAGIQIFLAAGIFTLLGEANLSQNYQWLGVSLALLGTDLALARAFRGQRPLAWLSRGFGALFVAFNTLSLLLSNSDPQISAICFAIYTLFFLVQTLVYRLSVLGYGFTLYSVLSLIAILKVFNQDNWLLPITVLAIIYYAVGFYFRKQKAGQSEDGKIGGPSFSWAFVSWTSGLGAGLLATSAAPFFSGLSAAIPVAVTATMVAVEAFDRRNVWLGFPANVLYLMAYFILLIDLNVDEPQFFSIATAALGLLMHYLLTRAGSRTGVLITGMVSQLVLLGTTYIQFLSTERLLFFTVMFFQALIVLVYGIIIRSRSLVITPIVFAVLSVLTVLYGLMQGIMTILLIGCTGIILLSLGIFAVIMRDRLKQISERFNDWSA
jgi:hypothetical protein